MTEGFCRVCNRACGVRVVCADCVAEREQADFDEVLRDLSEEELEELVKDG